MRAHRTETTKAEWEQRLVGVGNKGTGRGHGGAEQVACTKKRWWCQGQSAKEYLSLLSSLSRLSLGACLSIWFFSSIWRSPCLWLFLPFGHGYLRKDTSYSHVSVYFLKHLERLSRQEVNRKNNVVAFSNELTNGGIWMVQFQNKQQLLNTRDIPAAFGSVSSVQPSPLISHHSPSRPLASNLVLHNPI